MNETWLILDCNFMCYRLFHAMRQVTEGVVFGFLRDLTILQELHNAPRVAFCFDSKYSRRQEDYKDYKASRRAKYKDMPEDERQERARLHRQIARLRRYILPKLGYRNILCQRGYEADDMVAAVSEWMPLKNKGVIVGTDHDLYQCLRPNVMIWNPTLKKMMTWGSFLKEWGIPPSDWGMVMAIAGCDTDNITGIRGVGHKTAAKWVAGVLKPKTQKYEAISNGAGRMAINMPLVMLPYDGAEEFKPQVDETTPVKWERMIKHLNMPKLSGQFYA